MWYSFTGYSIDCGCRDCDAYCYNCVQNIVPETKYFFCRDSAFQFIKDLKCLEFKGGTCPQKRDIKIDSVITFR